MSQHQPQPGTLQAIRGNCGWYIYDKHGLYDGPYKSAADAYAVIASTESKRYA